MSPGLFIDGKEEKVLDSLDMPTPKYKDKDKNKVDICPVCKFRAKSIENERCNVCEERKTGRLNEWLSNRKIPSGSTRSQTPIIELHCLP